MIPNIPPEWSLVMRLLVPWEYMVYCALQGIILGVDLLFPFSKRDLVRVLPPVANVCVQCGQRAVLKVSWQCCDGWITFWHSGQCSTTGTKFFGLNLLGMGRSA